MDCLKWGYAGFALFMLIMIYPTWRYWLKNSPKAGKGDWQAFLFPITLVILFVAGLMWLVSR